MFPIEQYGENDAEDPFMAQFKQGNPDVENEFLNFMFNDSN